MCLYANFILLYVYLGEHKRRHDDGRVQWRRHSHDGGQWPVRRSHDAKRMHDDEPKPVQQCHDDGWPKWVQLQRSHDDRTQNGWPEQRNHDDRWLHGDGDQWPVQCIHHDLHRRLRKKIDFVIQRHGKNKSQELKFRAEKKNHIN